MHKRIFWLALAVLAGWIAWRWFQQREADFDNVASQRLPLEPLPPVARAPTAPVAIPPEQPAVTPAQTSTPPVAEVAEVAEAAEVAEDVEVAEIAEAAEVAEDVEIAEVAAPVEDAHAEAAAPEDALEAVTGYCVRCKTKRTISDAHEEITESGRRAARGICPVCGAKMFTFLPADQTD